MRTPAHRSADDRYRIKVIRSPAVKFRLDNPDDIRRIEQVGSMDFSAWVRAKLDEDHQKAQVTA